MFCFRRFLRGSCVTAIIDSSGPGPNLRTGLKPLELASGMRFDLNQLVQWMSNRAHRHRWPYVLYPRAVANEDYRDPGTVVDCTDRGLRVRQIHFRTPAFSSDRDTVVGL